VSTYLANQAKRAAWITGMRELIDFIEAHPAVPLPGGTTNIQVHPLGTDDEGIAVVAAAAAALGVEPGHEARGEHFLARRSFGPVTFTVVTVADAHMTEYRLRNQLGDEALAALKGNGAEYGECLDERMRSVA